MEELENAYQSLDMAEYINMLYDLGDIFYSMKVFDHEGELVATLDERSMLEVMPHFCDRKFWGWNVYSRTDDVLVLIDTFDTKEEGEVLIGQLRSAIQANESYFNLPY